MKLNGQMVYLWRAIDHDGEILESDVTKTKAGGGAEIYEEGAEAPWLSRDNHLGRFALVQGSNMWSLAAREAKGPPLGQQPGEELAPAAPTMGAGKAEVRQ